MEAAASYRAAAVGSRCSDPGQAVRIHAQQKRALQRITVPDRDAQGAAYPCLPGERPAIEAPFALALALAGWRSPDARSGPTGSRDSAPCIRIPPAREYCGVPAAQAGDNPEREEARVPARLSMPWSSRPRGFSGNPPWRERNARACATLSGGRGAHRPSRPRTGLPDRRQFAGAVGDALVGERRRRVRWRPAWPTEA
jgi:hypothetical protein